MEAKKFRERRRAIFAYAPLLLWVGVIFLLSSDHGSLSRTSMIIRPALTLLFPAASEETLQIYHVFVRKAAHFSEYAVLALLAARSLLTSHMPALSRFWFAFAIAIVLFTAVADEFNQGFSDLRTGSANDVAIDVLGGLAALLGIWLFRFRLKKSQD